MSQTVILVSPAPVDAYPPVQYQARILADAGYKVELLSQPLPQSERINFRYDGVRMIEWRPPRQGKPRLIGAIANAAQLVRYIAALSLLRLRAGTAAAEISYDPNGILISDYALFRPRRRIAHLHETVQRMDQAFIERRLKTALRGFQRIAVADEGRATLLVDQMNLPTAPAVVPNVPLASAEDAPGVETHAGFDVIYGGSLGSDQKIGLIIQSVPLWPADGRLILAGDDTRPHAQTLKTLVADLGLTERVIFEGWMNLDHLLARYRKAHLGISLLTANSAQWVLSVGASNKRYQYMQAGLPQIGDQMPGVPELLEGNGIGRCVVEYDEQAIADIVRHYHANPDQRREAGRKARALHLERSNYQKAFEPTLRWIAEGLTA